MTTKTEAQRDAETREEGAEVTTSEATEEATEAAGKTTKDAEDTKGVEAAEDQAAADDAAAEAAAEAELAALKDQDEKPSGIGQGAGAIVSVALGVVALSGNWLGTIASARAQLKGQLTTAQNAGIAKQISAMYGEAWHSAALVGGAFSLVALLVAAAVLARPAFGAPGKPQAPWIKSTAWAGFAVGAIGLVLAVAKYTDLILGMPGTSG
jgi:hypothetical protein